MTGSLSTAFIILASQGLTGFSIEIAQMFPLFLNFLKRKLFKLTPRQEFETNKPRYFDYTVYYGLQLYVWYFLLLTLQVLFVVILHLVAPDRALCIDFLLCWIFR